MLEIAIQNGSHASSELCKSPPSLQFCKESNPGCLLLPENPPSERLEAGGAGRGNREQASLGDTTFCLESWESTFQGPRRLQAVCSNGQGKVSLDPTPSSSQPLPPPATERREQPGAGSPDWSSRSHTCPQPPPNPRVLCRVLRAVVEVTKQSV